ncbi:MAG: glycolate oxidase subunit GlcF [Gammaproteobacteria bacterium]
MRVPVSADMAATSYAARAAEIARSCVHCGFCNATCPTYQLTGDELEGPRGRIYLIKSLLEDGAPGSDTRRHLDQCLVCRNCETTCPSGVRYGELVELVRPAVLRATPTPWREGLLRWGLLRVVPYPRRFAALLGLGRAVRPLLPARLAALVPRPLDTPAASPPATVRSTRRVLLLGGCVQPVLNPGIDAAARAVFARLDIELVTLAASGCCGALAHHLGDEDRARAQARANIDAWWPHVEAGAEAVMASSSGCGVQLKSYARLLADEPGYAARAQAIEARVRDPLELVDGERLAALVDAGDTGAVAVQAPCTLQHGQRLGGRLEALLRQLGFTLAPVAEAHLCCGSAGSYSLFHAATARALRERKLGHLLAAAPAVVVTANIGCQSHLAATAPVPVRHWLELVAARLVATSP